MLSQVQVLAPVVCALLAFLVSLAAMPPFIKALKAHKIKQFIREEGPKSHAGKADTPTAGGALFMVSFTLAVACGWLAIAAYSGASGDLRHESAASLPVVIAAIMCGLIGFWDDAAKIRHQSNAGISAKMRLALEALIGLALALMLLAIPLHNGDATSLTYATYDFLKQQCPALLVFLCVFLMMATTNAVNLHDGMDGLAGGTSVLAFATLAFMLYASGQHVLAMVATTACGAIGGFLVYNKNPAKIFMGDTGSLFIGGLMAGLVASSGMVLYFIPLSLIYILEALSVMAQVAYFKCTKEWQPEEPMSEPFLTIYKLTHTVKGEGKRLFRMAPLHHHFEAVFAEKGATESQVVLGFWIVQFALCTIVLSAWYTLH